MLNERQRLAARHDAFDMGRAEVAASAGVSEATIARWRRLPEYRAIVNDGRANLAALSSYYAGGGGAMLREAQRRILAGRS